MIALNPGDDGHQGDEVSGRTLSKPAMFLFSAKNSAGLFCCRMSAFLDMAAATQQD